MFSNSSQPQSDVMCMSEVMTQSFTLTPTVSGIRNRRIIRRKLRARRLPRSMSDGEQLGTWMNGWCCVINAIEVQLFPEVVYSSVASLFGLFLSEFLFSSYVQLTLK